MQVTLGDGSQRRMADLRVGDAVLSAAPDGTLAPRPVYLLAHADAKAVAIFTELEIEIEAGNSSAGSLSFRRLRLSERHFIPVRRGGAGAWVFSYARDVALGDVVRASVAAAAADAPGQPLRQHLQVLVEARVQRVRTIVDRGLYNPLVFGGLPVVNGVVASDQSEWILDDLVPVWVLPHLPTIYSTLFAPLRWAAAALGPRLWGETVSPAVAYLGHHHGMLLLVHLPAAAMALAAGASAWRQLTATSAK